MHPASNRFLTSLCSTSSELLFSQPLCFHNHLRCPLVLRYAGRSSTHSSLSRVPLITYMQTQQFHTITHSFAQQESAISLSFSSFRTLSLSTEGGTPLRPHVHGSHPRGVHQSLVTNHQSRPQSLHQSLVTTHQSPFQWAIIAIDHVESSQASPHQGRAVQHVPRQGDDQARLRQSTRPGSHPQHAPSRHRSRSLDLRTQVPRVRPSLRRQRQLHPQPQMPQVPKAASPARPSKWDSHFWLSAFHPNLSWDCLPRQGCTLSRRFAFSRIQIRQKRRQNSHRRQERANVVHKADVRRIRQFSQ